MSQDSEALMALAMRVEAAEAADRELDAAIAVALKIGCRANLPDDLEYLSEISPGDYEARHRKLGYYWFHCRSGKSMRAADRFTLSLDFAILLVPAGYAWEVGQADGRTGATVSSTSDDMGDCTMAATPALALTAACLKALATKE